MTPDPLDQLVTDALWKPDWQGVLARAGEPTRQSGRPHRLTKKRVLIALAVLAAVLVPIAAVAADSNWWFLRSGGTPPPLSAPVVVKEGEWDGQPWKLVAYPSTTKGLCFSLTPEPLDGYGAVMACAPIEGAPRTDEATGAELGITYVTGLNDDFPPFVAGPVTGNAATVEVHFQTGETLRLPTFSAPESIGDVRFYASQLPPSLTSPTIAKLVGLDKDGTIVACLVPIATADGVPLPSQCH